MAPPLTSVWRPDGALDAKTGNPRKLESLRGFVCEEASLQRLLVDRADHGLRVVERRAGADIKTMIVSIGTPTLRADNVDELLVETPLKKVSP